MTVALLVQLIEQGIVLIPQFASLWNEVKGTYSSEDQAAVDAALAKARAADDADTKQADQDLTDAGAKS